MTEISTLPRFGKTCLVIPDSHALSHEHPDEFDRFSAAGNAIRDLRPDFVVCLGDIADFPSLNPHRAKAAAAFDGDALKRDVSAFREALATLMGPTKAANARHKRARHAERIHDPEWIFCEGNHEERFRRFPETKFMGHDYLAEIARGLGWEWAPFLEPVEIESTLFAHYFPAGVSGKPAQVSNILTKTHRSCVWGHTHSFGFDQRPVLGGGTISALCAGCYKPPHRTGPHEWSGLTLLTDMRDGQFSIQQIPYDHVMERWGEGGYAQELRTARAQEHRLRRTAGEAFGIAAE